MKPQKLLMDVAPQGQPDGTYPYGKNGIQDDLLGARFNEPGFRKMAAVTPYKLMGVIETDDKPVLFSTDNTYSAIGYFDPGTETYIPIVNDQPGELKNWPATGELLGFHQDYYITGQAQRNYKGETIVAFTDKRPFPKYLNCDSPQITRKDDLRMFPFYKAATVELSETTGGLLEPGSYYVAINYEKKDGTVSPMSEVSAVQVIAPGATQGLSDKALAIGISNADTSYDFIRVTIISKVNGKTSAVQLLDQVIITGADIEVIYTGDNLSEPISVQEVLTPPAVYDRIGALGQLNDALYAGNLHREAPIDDMQPYANLVTVRWVSSLIDATAPPVEHIQGKKKSFMHGEVGALYIRYRLTRGGYTKGFHLPGLSGVAADFENSTEAVAGGATSVYMKYVVEDTIPSYDAGTFTGQMGTHRNENEIYPNTPDFDSTALGGRDLRGQKVLHHKFPTLRWCKEHLYGTDDRYGRTHLDLLGIQVDNIQIPAKYAGVIDGYEILYAKRTTPNMTQYGQAVLLHAACSRGDMGNSVDNIQLYTSGGNWWVNVLHGGTGDYDDNQELGNLRLDTFRVHPFDLLLNKPSIKPDFLSAQLKLRRENLRAEGYLEDNFLYESQDGPQVMLVDYTTGNVPALVASGLHLKKVRESQLLSAGISVNNFNNVRHETCFAGLLAGEWPLYFESFGYRLKGASFTDPSNVTDYEECYLINLVGAKENVYNSFYTQQLVSAGGAKALADTTPFWGGDTFLCDYTFHTYGRHDTVDTHGDGIRGKKAIRRFVCESAANIHLRYEIPGNEYSKWYPRTSVAMNNPDQCYITRFDRSKDPNQFGYSKDLNALNDFVSSRIFSPFLEEILDFPYRVHRGGKLSRQNKPRAWRSFLALDYYEMQKNMGPIINLEGQDDTLLIHMENALFRTQDKAKLDAGLLSVTLGTGDIFQFEPQPGLDTKLGYAGTRHDLACVKTPMGYVFPDAGTGELFLLKGTLKSLNTGAETFLRNALKVAGKNPYTGDGITIGWDQYYKRLLLTVKNEGRNFTMSYSVKGESWAFFHDYVPDMYIHTRNNLYSSYPTGLYRHHDGPPGKYDGAVKPFFIDVVFRNEASLILETINWVDDILKAGVKQPFTTLTHITVWNGSQHTGRIPMSKVLGNKLMMTRNTKGEWVFNAFRSILKEKGTGFLGSLFQDFALDTTKVDTAMPWYRQERLTGNWFCIRFEFDNLSGDTCVLHETSVQALKSDR